MGLDGDQRLLGRQIGFFEWMRAGVPIFIALLGWLVLKEKLNLIQIGGIVLAMIGVLVIVSKGDLAHLGTGGTSRRYRSLAEENTLWRRALCQ